jgi:hypothetical protein
MHLTKLYLTFAAVIGLAAAAPTASGTFKSITSGVTDVTAAAPKYNAMPTLRQQVEIEMKWVADRVENLLPTIMEKNGVELWIVSQRECTLFQPFLTIFVY